MKNLIVIIIAVWLLQNVLSYFVLPFFVDLPLHFAVCVGLVATLIFFISGIVKEKAKLHPRHFLEPVTVSLLIFLSVFGCGRIPGSVIESADWELQKESRKNIVAQILNGKIQVKDGNSLYKLPFNFPVLSHDGNEILIFNNRPKEGITVKFWISRAYHATSQSYFVYTTDGETINRYVKMISTNPENNRRLEKNWFRVLDPY